MNANVVWVPLCCGHPTQLFVAARGASWSLAGLKWMLGSSSSHEMSA